MSKSLLIYYGIDDKYEDVTILVLKNFINDSILKIPAGDDERAKIFGDPAVGIYKNIKIIYDGSIYIYPHDKEVNLEIEIIHCENCKFKQQNSKAESKLSSIHKSLSFTGGSIKEEYTEQLMAAMYINKDAKVLEIGGNIGRNTLTIASLLSDPYNLVVLESDPESYKILKFNIEQNKYSVRIENSALSKRKLFQKEWNTYTENEKPEDAYEIKTIIFSELEEKYNIQFDTLVADCEGALYYIFSDDPGMLDNINMIIMENDYLDIEHKNTIDKIIMNKGFSRIYVKEGGWGPCYSMFYEVWQKKYDRI